MEVGYKDGKGFSFHDIALEKATSWEYSPPRVEREPRETLFIKGLSQISKNELITSLSKYGKLTSVNLVKDKITGENRGYAFAKFDYLEDAERAFRQLWDIGGERVLVDYMRGCGGQEGWKPRKLGGGYGGKIKSSQIRFGGRDRPFGMTGKMNKSVRVNNTGRHRP